MSSQNVSMYAQQFAIAMMQSTQKDGTPPPEFMTAESYIDYAFDPNRRSPNIDHEEFENLTKIINEGEQSTIKEIRDLAAEYKKKLETLEELTIEQEYGVTKEEFDAGNRGTYNTRQKQINNRVILLLNELEKLDNNSSLKDVIMNIFTGELTKKRDEIAKELIKLTEETDLLNSKISTKAILTLKGKELSAELSKKLNK